LPAGTMDVLEVLAIARVADRAELLVHHDLREADDGIERGTNFMADLRQKIRLGGGSTFGSPCGFEKLLLVLLELGNLVFERCEPGGGLALCAHRNERMGVLALPFDADQLAFERGAGSAVHSQNNGLITRHPGGADRFDQELVKSPRRCQCIEARVPAPIQELRVGIEQPIETIDEDGSWELVEQRAWLVRHMAEMGLRDGGIVMRRGKGCSLRVRVCARSRKSLGELARYFAKRHVLDRRQAR